VRPAEPIPHLAIVIQIADAREEGTKDRGIGMQLLKKPLSDGDAKGKKARVETKIKRSESKEQKC